MVDPTDFGDLPTDDKTAGSTGHVEDHNKLTRELAEVQDVVTQIWTNGIGFVGAVASEDQLPLTGVPGQMYLVGAEDSIVYNWIDGAWVPLQSIRGPQGLTGASAQIGVLSSPDDVPPEGSSIGSLWWVPGDTVVLPPAQYAVPSVVGTPASTMTLSGTAATVSLPTGDAAGDFGVAVVGYNYSYTVTPTPGWTLYGTINYGSGSFGAAIFTRLFDGSEGANFVSTVSTASKQAVSLVVLRGVVGNVASFPAPVINDDVSPVTPPATTHTDKFVVIGGHVDRGGGFPITTITAPASFDGQTAAYGTGGGQVAIATAWEMTVQDAGTTYAPGTWTFTPATGTFDGGVITWSMALEVARV